MKLADEFNTVHGNIMSEDGMTYFRSLRYPITEGLVKCRHLMEAAFRECNIDEGMNIGEYYLCHMLYKRFDRSEEYYRCTNAIKYALDDYSYLTSKVRELNSTSETDMAEVIRGHLIDGIITSDGFIPMSAVNFITTMHRAIWIDKMFEGEKNDNYR